MEKNWFFEQSRSLQDISWIKYRSVVLMLQAKYVWATIGLVKGFVVDSSITRNKRASRSTIDDVSDLKKQQFDFTM